MFLKTLILLIKYVLEVDEFSTRLAVVIKRRREALKMPLYKLAREAKLDQTTPGKIEKGAFVPSINTVAAIAKALDVPLWKLVREAESDRI
jgi:transcriptional regulator with XRE-family HTH domain